MSDYEFLVNYHKRGNFGKILLMRFIRIIIGENYESEYR